jgi:DNA end-binding protein Ku
MAPRAYWKGYLKLSLVSCPIALNPATSSSERVSFRQINKRTGHRLRQQLVDDETREPVEADDRGKGFEVAKNEYLLIEDDELEALEIESNHTIDIDRIVPASQIDKRYFDSPYYIVPSDKVGQEAFAVIRDAMKGQGMVALGRIVVSKRERVIALEPQGKGLLGTTLHDDVALCLRSQACRRIFRRHPGYQGVGRDVAACPAHSADQGGRF